jgi:pSer/pThr/pTyr-binding forkhead associated (FHA) protein
VKAVIEPGKSLRVGRTERADLGVPHDGKLSGAHFELLWDGERCRLRDLGSIGGTELKGAPVKEAEVSHGGWIRAGETDFLVYFEGRTPPPEDADSDIESDNANEGELREEAKRGERRGAVEKAFGVLREEAAKEPLYVVLDAARDDRILEIVRESVEPHRSLYEGADGEVFDEVAPYLVGPMRLDSRLLERLVLEGWGKRWGIYCASREPFREVRRHFRRFLMVELEGTREKVYFRFYDPWVMRVFWPTCSGAQRSELMGRVGCIFIEDADMGVSVLRL